MGLECKAASGEENPSPLKACLKASNGLYLRDQEHILGKKLEFRLLEVFNRLLRAVLKSKSLKILNQTFLDFRLAYKNE
jgi:hypothetical protein